MTRMLWMTEYMTRNENTFISAGDELDETGGDFL